MPWTSIARALLAVELDRCIAANRIALCLVFGQSVRSSQEYETIHSNLVNCYDNTFLGQ